MSINMGFYGDADQPDVLEAIGKGIAGAQASGIPFGTGKPTDDQY